MVGIPAGFDYGTSHCAIGLLTSDGVQLAPLEGTAPLVPSTLYSPTIGLQLPVKDGRLRLEAPAFTDLRFGAAALEAYLRDPTQGYFVKSPKSFLGVAGLNRDIRERFVTVVAAMMANVKRHADRTALSLSGESVTQAVIGRPVNFQGLGGREANDQALSMLREAALRAGFRDVAFQYEPMAAALEYEQRLRREEDILVVDIGGGTTDVSFVRVGGALRDSIERDPDVLGHAGERLGGNDYDQVLALQAVMPEFGFGDHLTTGLPVPNTYFVDAVSINDVNAQQRFYSAATLERLQLFAKEAVPAQRCARLLALREQRATYRLLREVEMGKIELSAREGATVDCSALEQGLFVPVTGSQLAQACARLLEHLRLLIDEVATQAGRQPQRVYLTGGMSKATVVRNFLAATYAGVEFIDSDHFVSVTEGLTLWANRLYGGAIS